MKKLLLFTGFLVIAAGQQAMPPASGMCSSTAGSSSGQAL